MTVGQLFSGVPGAELPPVLVGQPVAHLRLDSRQVERGDLFFALSGQHRQGREYASAALAAGALGVVSEEALEGLPTIRVTEARRALAYCAAELSGHPDRKLRLIGVTGTNGKTTTALLVASVAQAAGEPVGVIGTVGYRVGNRQVPAPFTTPEAPELCELLSAMVDAGVKSCAMEVSSHALAQHRVSGLRFAAAGFTQLTRDHLDFHHDMESYFQAKRRLFVELLTPGAPIVVNGDDPHGARLAGELSKRASVWRFGRAHDAELRLDSVETTLQGTTLRLQTPVGPLVVRSPLIGAHNAENLALAAGLSLAVGYPIPVVTAGLAALQKVPGRLERVGTGRVPAFVDYAHTDDALTRVCAALRSVGARRLVLVFGCGGDRDPGKRPLMGEAAARGADLVVATSDNPRSEAPEAILAQILPGLEKGGAVALSSTEARPGARGFLVEPDRAKAVRLAVRLAGPETVLLVAGKGHEDYQIIGNQRLHFDDREALAAALAEVGA